MLPMLVIIGPDGKTLNPNAAELVEAHGIQVYPFTPERLDELADMERRRLELQTLESILVSGERDFVINRNGVKAPLSTLVGKNILLYLGNHHWCRSSRAFLRRLINAYDEIKARDNDNFEIIFITVDKDQNSFDETLSEMTWFALPFGDQRCESLSCKTFTILTIPSLVVIGPTGKTFMRQGADFLIACGSDAYPFTEEHLKDMEAKFEEMAKVVLECDTHSPCQA